MKFERTHTFGVETNRLFREDSCSSAEIRISLHEPKLEENTRHCRVRFREDVSVREVEHVNDYTNEEVANSWYRKIEYTMMRMDMTATANMIVRGVYEGDTHELCARGTESKSPAVSRSRRDRKLQSSLAVLEEQDKQDQMKTGRSPEALACVYMQANAACRKEAVTRGELDAVEAMFMYTGQESLTKRIFKRNSVKKQREADVKSLLVNLNL